MNARRKTSPPPVTEDAERIQPDKSAEVSNLSKPKAPTRKASRPLGAEPLQSVLDSDPALYQSYDVFARVSGFYPMLLEDFVVLHCTNCRRTCVVSSMTLSDTLTDFFQHPRAIQYMHKL